MSEEVNNQTGTSGTNNGANGDEKTPKTYTAEEYQALQSQLEKQKNAFDKTAKELSQIKKENTAKLSETEQKDARIKELEDEIKSTTLEFNKSKLSSSLTASGYSEKEAQALTDSFLSNDLDGFINAITTSRKSLVETHDKAMKELELSTMQRPPISSGSMSSIEEANASYKKAQEAGDAMAMIKAINQASKLNQKK